MLSGDAAAAPNAKNGFSYVAASFSIGITAECKLWKVGELGLLISLFLKSSCSGVSPLSDDSNPVGRFAVLRSKFSSLLITPLFSIALFVLLTFLIGGVNLVKLLCRVGLVVGSSVEV